MDYATYYQSIEKPFFAPPEWVFGLAWGLIYPLIAIAFVTFLFLWYRGRRASGAAAIPTYLLTLFLINLVANLLFTPIQLVLMNTPLATLDILVVLGTLAFFEYKIYAYSKLVFALLLPYLFWGAFATVLQITILFMN